MSTVLADGQCQIVVTCTWCGAQLLPGGGTVQRNAEELTSRQLVTGITLQQLQDDLEREGARALMARVTDSHENEGDDNA
jgi:hypothetical protein